MVRGFSIKATIAAAIVAAIISLFFVAGQVSARPSWAAAAKPSSLSIVDVAVGAEFTVLVAAAQHAGLVDLLSGNQQLTVFAPTDDAFIAFLGAEVSTSSEAIEAIESLPPEAVGEILAYHVIEGRRNSRSVLAAPTYGTLSGQQLTRGELNPGALDISARNGIVHIVNEVLVPPQLR